MEDTGARLGWSSPVIADGRVWLTTAIEQRGISPGALAFATGREVVNVEAFNIPSSRREINPKNSWASPTPVIDNGRVYVHLAPTARRRSIHQARSCGRRDSITTAWRRRIADRLRRSADLQLRRQRRGVRGRARQKHRQGEMETNRGFLPIRAYTTPLVIPAPRIAIS